MMVFVEWKRLEACLAALEGFNATWQDNPFSGSGLRLVFDAFLILIFFWEIHQNVSESLFYFFALDHYLISSRVS